MDRDCNNPVYVHKADINFIEVGFWMDKIFRKLSWCTVEIELSISPSCCCLFCLEPKKYRKPKIILGTENHNMDIMIVEIII